MNPQERARNLVGRFRRYAAITTDELVVTRTENAKECAIICVDELIRATVNDENAYEYWNKVKEEIKQIR